MRSRNCGPPTTAQRGGIYLSEGGGGQRNPYGNLSAPPQGYIWDMAMRAGVSVRSYGEFVNRDEKTGLVEASVPGLKGRFSPDYPPYNVDIPDNTRVDAWLREFREFERTGDLPRLSIIRLGNDHTAGTRPGARTPRAMIAENDDALGRLVETISHSRVLERVGHLRARGRRAERTGPRGRAPIACARRSAPSSSGGPSTARSTRRRPCCARWS